MVSSLGSGYKYWKRMIAMLVRKSICWKLCRDVTLLDVTRHAGEECRRVSWRVSRVTVYLLEIFQDPAGLTPPTTHQMPLVFIFQNKLKLGMSKPLLSVGILQVFFIFSIKKSFMMFTELPLPWVGFLANSHDSPIPMILHWPGATTPEDIGETLTGESGQFSVALSSSSVVSVSIISG